MPDKERTWRRLPPPDAILSTTEATRLLQVSPKLVRKWVLEYAETHPGTVRPVGGRIGHLFPGRVLHDILGFSAAPPGAHLCPACNGRGWVSEDSTPSEPAS
jgi:hypothetical protein